MAARSLVKSAVSFAVFSVSLLSAQERRPFPLRDWDAHPAIVEVDRSQELYVIGDVHGDCERMLALLKAGGLSDGGKWVGGTATLVFLGDMIDKGPRSVDTLQAILALQFSAQSQGGRVIALMGNHEAEFLADPNGKKSAEFSKDLKQKGGSARDVANCRGALGEFLCSLPIAARVDDWFFSHAGNTDGRSLVQLKTDLQLGIAKRGFASPELSGANSIVEARLGEAGPGGRPWFDGDLPKRNAQQLLADYAKTLGVHHLVQGHQPGNVAFDDGTTRKAGEAFQRWCLLFLMDTGLSRGIDNSTGALLHISQARSVASALCADGSATVIWDLKGRGEDGHAAACGKSGR